MGIRFVTIDRMKTYISNRVGRPRVEEGADHEDDAVAGDDLLLDEGAIDRDHVLLPLLVEVDPEGGLLLRPEGGALLRGQGQVVGQGGEGVGARHHVVQQHLMFVYFNLLMGTVSVYLFECLGIRENAVGQHGRQLAGRQRM